MRAGSQGRHRRARPKPGSAQALEEAQRTSAFDKDALQQREQQDRTAYLCLPHTQVQERRRERERESLCQERERERECVRTMGVGLRARSACAPHP